jgi:hypothetical protein
MAAGAMARHVKGERLGGVVLVVRVNIPSQGKRRYEKSRTYRAYTSRTRETFPQLKRQHQKFARDLTRQIRPQRAIRAFCIGVGVNCF